MYWDSQERTLWIGHSSIGIRSPIIIHVSQIKLALGITCPRHRAIWKAKLGRFGRWIPDLEWQEDRLVRVRHKT
jgi:hypothetical protein